MGGGVGVGAVLGVGGADVVGVLLVGRVLVYGIMALVGGFVRA